jgi:hypothetical protein
LLGPALRRGVVPDFSGCCARLGDIISNLLLVLDRNWFIQPWEGRNRTM